MEVHSYYFLEIPFGRLVVPDEHIIAAIWFTPFNGVALEYEEKEEP